MRILLIGNGGREHAMAWKLVQSPHVERLYVAPGNGGTATLAKTENIAIAATDLGALEIFADQAQVDLTIVGPEAPLVAGIVDRFAAAGLRCFGPSRAAAQLEGSKAFSKQFMQRRGIPTARAVLFDDYATASRYLDDLPEPPVIKASGLAAGKGVIVPADHAAAAAALHEILREQRFGAAGATVLLEERLIGPELSVIAVCDGENYQILPPAQDYKRLLDGNQGPNTGGMGAFAPSPLATLALLAEIERTVLTPTLAGMADEGAPYRGILYAGLMLTADGPKVLEYNCRFGDPEAQVILPLLESDLVELILAGLDGDLAQAKPQWREQSAVTVVMVAGGYPDSYASGDVVEHIDAAAAAGCLVFHAGTALQEGRLVTTGGRVLDVTALGDDLAAAAKIAYAGVQQIRFADARYRTDIGRQLT